MEDEGQKNVNKEIKRIEGQITSIYGQAQLEIEEKIRVFEDNFAIKNDIYYQKYLNGEITEDDYNSWYAGQMFQSKQWNTKKRQICGILHDANNQANQIVNGGTISAFVEGANWTAYSLEHNAGVNFGFGLYNREAVTSLIKDDPQILPEWKIDEPKEYVWNQQKVNNCITQGIIQGENVQDIGKRIATVTCNQNKNLAMTHAQTALGAAQGAGTYQRLLESEELGINVVKEWMATLDGHTRDSHRHMDGEQVKPVSKPFSNGCLYPCDPHGPAHEVFNCRCTLVGDIEDYPEEYQRYDNIEGMPVKEMTYKQWTKTKSVEKRLEDKANRPTVTEKTLAKAHEAETKVSADLMDAVNLGTGHLEGFDYRFKSEGSLSRKIRDKSIKKGLSEEEYAEQITDALRYTNLSTTENFTSDYFTVTGYLTENGYIMVEVVNTMWDAEAPYRGINTLVRTPEGYVFELQFHTPESIEIKEINHKLYEEQRLASTTPARYKELDQEMKDNAASIPTPPNAKSIENVG